MTQDAVIQNDADEQPEMKALKSYVYLFDVTDPRVLLAVHVPQHTVALSNTALRSVVCSVANVLPDVNVPLAAMHWVSQPAREGVDPSSVFGKRLELNLADTGTEVELLALRKHAEGGAAFFVNLLSSTAFDAFAASDVAGDLVSALVEVRYNNEGELIGGTEVSIYSSPAARSPCATLRQLIALCDANAS